MTTDFITIAEAVQMTGKSRRTIQRLVESLQKTQPDQVMKEKTAHGYVWRINKLAVQEAYGVAHSPTEAKPLEKQPQASEPVAEPQSKQYLEVALQGYRGMMAMHQEVKQVYEARLKEKDERIMELTQDLLQVRKGFWGRLFG